MYNIDDLNNKLVGELRDIAKSLNIPKFDTLKKQELVDKIMGQQSGKSNDHKPERILRPRKNRPESSNPVNENEQKVKQDEPATFFNDDDFETPKKEEPIVTESPAEITVTEEQVSADTQSVNRENRGNGNGNSNPNQ